MRIESETLHRSGCAQLIKKSEHRKEVSRMTATMVKDPVCGMYLDIYSDPPKTEYEGETYYFCGLEHKRSFEEAPEKYIENGHKADESQR